MNIRPLFKLREALKSKLPSYVFVDDIAQYAKNNKLLFRPVLKTTKVIARPAKLGEVLTTYVRKYTPLDKLLGVRSAQKIRSAFRLNTPMHAETSGKTLKEGDMILHYETDPLGLNQWFNTLEKFTKDYVPTNVPGVYSPVLDKIRYAAEVPEAIQFAPSGWNGTMASVNTDGRIMLDAESVIHLGLGKIGIDPNKVLMAYPISAHDFKAYSPIIGDSVHFKNGGLLTLKNIKLLKKLNKLYK